ncbi:ABC transporter permease [Novosphingobium sp. Gsoil 351]|uniref:ABC transporter permease n=1 Tax=Novosphingobium sp. Gsoil 351 TaxID=2675225 RepID=UPI0012B4535B|nr:ABC transporter permease [Novosphingobium sp. Gsoil 351]QGN55381.1 ABC transporter permease [Novosphingobium sp. Gsoil 351]
MTRTIRSAWVIARRDFVAVIFSKTFLFFLLGPLFPILVGGLAGGIGAQVAKSVENPQIGLAMGGADNLAMVYAHDRMAGRMAGEVPEFIKLKDVPPGDKFDAVAAMRSGGPRLAAVVTGSIENPHLTGTGERLDRYDGMIATMAATARNPANLRFPEIATTTIATSAAKVHSGRLATAQAAQTVLFLLTMLLAGMVLSNLVEEKSNKIIEVLAAAIPMDAVFLGKLFAMLAVSLVGIGVWFTVGSAVIAIGGQSLPTLPEPAVGWPLFLGLGFLYFATAYLLLGSLFLGIGSMAATVREVQTMSMPVTMMQLLVFFFASFTVAQQGKPMELLATIVPFSSPFAMLARAAQSPALWPHLLALAWQALCVAGIIRLGAGIFRRSVMKSGPARGKAQRLSLFGRKRTATLVDTREGLAG